MSNFNSWKNSLSNEERLAIAEKKSAKLLDLGIELVYYHASNRVVAFTDVLSSQIPMSYAGHAFAIFQRGLFEIEVIKLARLWEKSDQHSFGIPTVWQLVRDHEFQSYVKNKHFTLSSYGDNSRELDRRWARLNRLLKRDGRSSPQLAVINFRDKYLAHALEQTFAETKGVVFQKVAYRDVRRLMYRTLSVINVLDLAIRRSGFQWKGSCDIARRNAEALWRGCTFKVLE